MSKSAKKRRRKKGSFCQIEVAGGDTDTASMEVCLHEVVKFETRGNLVRESEWTEDTAKPVLAIEPVDVFTTDANQVDYADLAGEFVDPWSDKTFEDNLVAEADCHEVDVFTADVNQVDYVDLAGEFEDPWSDKTFEDNLVTEADCHEVDVFTTDANQVDYGALANEFTDTGSEKTFEDKMVTVNGNTSATRQSENLSTCKHCLGESHGRDDKRTRKSVCPAWGS